MRSNVLGALGADQSLTVLAAGVFLSATLTPPWVLAADPTPTGPASIGSVGANAYWVAEHARCASFRPTTTAEG
jgi:hypothetical protein